MTEPDMAPGDVNVAGVHFADDEATLPQAKEILKQVSDDFTHHIRAKNREMTQKRAMQGSMMAYTRRTQELLRDRHLYHAHGPGRNKSPETFQMNRQLVALPSISVVDPAKSLSLTSRYFQSNTHLNRKSVNGEMPTSTEYKVQLVNPLSQSDPTGLSLDFVRRADKPSPGQEGHLLLANAMRKDADDATDKKANMNRKVRTKLVFLKDESQLRTPRRKKTKKESEFEWVHTESRTLKISLQLPRVENEPDSPTMSPVSMATDPDANYHKHTIGSESAISTCILCSLANKCANHASSIANSLNDEKTGGGHFVSSDRAVLQGDDSANEEDSFSDSDFWPTRKSNLENPLHTSVRTFNRHNKKVVNEGAFAKHSKKMPKGVQSSDRDGETRDPSSVNEHGQGNVTELRKRMKKKVRASIARKNRSMGVVPQSTPTSVKTSSERKKRHSPVKSRTKLKVLPIKDASQTLDIDEQSYHKSYKVIHHDPPSVRKLKSLMAHEKVNGDEFKNEEVSGKSLQVNRGTATSSDSDLSSAQKSPENSAKRSEEEMAAKQSTQSKNTKEEKGLRGKENEPVVTPEEILSRYNVELEQSSNPSKFPGGKITLSDVTSYVDDSFIPRAMMEEKKAMKRTGKMNRQNQGPCVHGNVKEKCRSCIAIEAAEAMLGQQIDDFENTHFQWNIMTDKVDRLRWGQSKLMRGLPPPSTDAHTKSPKPAGSEDAKTEHALGLPSIATGVEFTDDASLKSYLAGLNDSGSNLSAGRLGKKVRFTEQVEVREIAIYRDSDKPLRKPRRGKKNKQQQRQEIIVDGGNS